MESVEPSPQLTWKVAVTPFAFVVSLSRYTVSFTLASVISLPPDTAKYKSKSAFGSPVYKVIRSVAVNEATLPSPRASVFLAYTTTSKGELVLSV